jgi:cytochrome b involved in lipid metabolism
MEKELDTLERLDLNPEILNKIQTIEELRKYIDGDVFDLTKFLDDNNIKKYED